MVNHVCAAVLIKSGLIRALRLGFKWHLKSLLYFGISQLTTYDSPQLTPGNIQREAMLCGVLLTTQKTGYLHGRQSQGGQGDMSPTF